MVRVCCVAVLLFACGIASAVAEPGALGRSLSSPLGALESIEVASTEPEPQYGIVICDGGRPLIKTAKGLVSAAVGIAQLHRTTKRLKALLEKAFSRGKKLRLKSQIRRNDAVRREAIRGARRCLSEGGDRIGAIIGGPSISGSYPAPNAQNQIVVSELPQTAGGRYRLGIVGNGFAAGQILRAQIGDRLVSVKHTLQGAQELTILLSNPVTAEVDLWLEQLTPNGTVSSNILSLSLVAVAPSGALGDHVATIAHDAPVGVASYTTSAVIPLPPGLLSVSDQEKGRTPLSIEVGGIRTPLQVTGLSRYPDGISFDTALVSARVNVGQSGGGSYRIFREDGQLTPTSPAHLDARSLVLNSPLTLHPEVRALFSAPGRLLARAHDPFGHAYSCDLTQNEQGPVRVYEYGAERLAFRVFCMLLPEAPVAGSAGTLPHLMGMLAYIVVNSHDEAIRVTLTTTNSIAGAPLHNNDARATALGDLFFRDLAVQVEGDYDTTFSWTVPTTVPSTRANGVTTISIASPRSDGKMHFLRQLWEATTEFSLHTRTEAGYAAGAVLARYQDISFTVDGVSGTNPSLTLFSPANRHTARFGIAPSPWPSLAHLGVGNVRSNLTGKFTATKNFFNSGMCPIVITDVNGVPTEICGYPYLGTDVVTNSATTPLLAFHHGPWGVKYGGMTSGAEITPGAPGFDTWATRSGDGLMEQYLRMNARLLRNPVLRMLTGEPLSPSEATRIGQYGAYIPIRAFNGYDFNFCGLCDSLFGFRNAPVFQANYVLQNGLAPEYYSNMKGYHPEDDQHLIRLTAPLYAVLHLSGAPRARDMAMTMGHYAAFANSDKPLYFNGATPVYQSEALPGFRRGQSAVGTSVGRAFAHLQSARVMAYALGDDALRTEKLPYHRFVANEIMARSQMWTGLLVKNSYYAKTSPNGRCNVSITREEGFIGVSNKALLERVLVSGDPSAAAALSNVILDHALAYLIHHLVTPQNGWFAPYINVPVSHETSPNAIFGDWGSVPPACQSDALAWASAGEHLHIYSYSDMIQHSPGLWAMVKGWLMKSNSTPGTTLQKLEGISLYNLQRTDNVANLGWCQAMEKEIPGYCG